MISKPLIGVLCCNEFHLRPVQTVASRFVHALASGSGVDALLVPAIPDALDVPSIAARLDGLLLTGSQSNLEPDRYGAQGGTTRLDRQRDTAALSLADAMISAAKPVFGICRGLQEINVLFGGTLRDVASVHQHPAVAEVEFERLFEHRHQVEIVADGQLAGTLGSRVIAVNSVHEQGVDRIGSGLQVEARSLEDGLVEALSGEGCGAPVLGVQWHPEWDFGSCSLNVGFFTTFGKAARESSRTRLQI